MSDFTHERLVDEHTGRSRLLVRLAGEACLQLPIPGPIARSFVGFASILKDLEDVLAFIHQAYSLLPARTESEDQTTLTLQYAELSPSTRLTAKALFFSAISLYGRCFVSAEGRGTTLSRDDHVEPIFRHTHDRIMRLRHGIVAHAGNEFDDGEAIVAFVKKDHRFHVAANLWRLDFEDDREISVGFEQLVRHLLPVVSLKQSVLVKKLIDGPALDIVREQQLLEDN